METAWKCTHVPKPVSNLCTTCVQAWTLLVHWSYCLATSCTLEVHTGLGTAWAHVYISKQFPSLGTPTFTAVMFAQCVTLPPFHSPPLATHQTVENLVSVLEGLQQWDENVLQANASKLAINKYFLISPSSGQKYHCYLFLFLAVLCVPLTQWSVYLLSSWKTDRIFLS